MNLAPNAGGEAELESATVMPATEEGEVSGASSEQRFRSPGQIVVFVGVVQTILWLGHAFVYATWITFWGQAGRLGLGVGLGVLSLSFVTASLVAWRTSSPVARWFYTAGAVWLGLFNFLFLASGLAWLMDAGLRLAGRTVDTRLLVGGLFALAISLAVYGFCNAAIVRVRRVTVRLPQLPAAWRGKVAVVVGDVHLGHIRGAGFLERLVTLVNRQRPDVVFLTGDLFDGTAVNAEAATRPLKELVAPWGAYFVAGNHEEFGDSGVYLASVGRAGVRVLNNESITLEGLRLIGVHHGAASDPERLSTILRRALADGAGPSVLLSHAPENLGVVRQAGVSLQLSGHTHGGQFLPWTWAAARVHGAFVAGLNRLGDLQVLTTTGAGTWGPPMRVGTQAEVVRLQFE